MLPVLAVAVAAVTAVLAVTYVLKDNFEAEDPCFVHALLVMFFVLLVKFFDALLRGPSADVVGATRTAKRQYKYEKCSVEAKIELGGRAATFLQSVYGQERATLILNGLAERANGSQPSFDDDAEIIDLDESAPSQVLADNRPCIPYGFWRRFMVEELAIQPTDRKRKQLFRSLQFYVLRKREGASTPAAMRGMRAPNSCRDSGGAFNSRKAPGLGFALLQFFVDYVQRLMTRADSCLYVSTFG